MKMEKEKKPLKHIISSNFLSVLPNIKSNNILGCFSLFIKIKE